MTTTGLIISVTDEKDLGVFLAEQGFEMTHVGDQDNISAFKITHPQRPGEVFLTLHVEEEDDVELIFQTNVATERELGLDDPARDLEFKNRLLELATYLDGVAIGRDAKSIQGEVMIVVTEKRRAFGLDDFEISYILDALWEAQEAIFTIIEQFTKE